MPTLPEPPNPLLLAGLRKALTGPRPLCGPGEESLFPGGKTGKALAELAIKEEWLTTTKVKIQSAEKKAKTVEMGALTDKGRAHVLEADSPKTVLESLLPLVRILAETPSQTRTSPTVSLEVQTTTDTCRRMLQDVAAGLQQAVQKAIENAATKLQTAIASTVSRLEMSLLQAVEPTTCGSTPNFGLLAQAIETAVHRITTSINNQPSLASLESPTAGNDPREEQTKLENEIAAFVDAWAKEKTVGPQFDTIWNHLEQRIPNLTIGAFQDALRKLHSEHRVRLSGWPRMLDDLPEPKLALFLASKVMYYAQPSR